jgi:uncharacterized protein
MVNSSLDHLPESKRGELGRITEILFSDFGSAIAGGKSDAKRNGKILKVVLFGSYARGDWVSDPVGGYVSDYDLLVVVNDDKLTDVVDSGPKLTSACCASTRSPTRSPRRRTSSFIRSMT